jgi:hypothetical protein
MSIERMRKRLAAERASFVEPCLPSPADKPPSGSSWIHEIKHDGYRLMACQTAGSTALSQAHTNQDASGVCTPETLIANSKSVSLSVW